MKKHYPWLWFDADGTLFDYHRAEGVALHQTFQALATPYEDSHLAVYRRINRELWQALEKQEITPEVLQVRRFELLLEVLQLSLSPAQMGAVYLDQLAQCAELIDGAFEVLHTLHTISQIAIVTNGYKIVQASRMALSPIGAFVRHLVISEEVGASKPDPAFFEAAFAQAGYPPRSDVLIIGDSLTSDMKGGVDAGIDTCWYNPSGEPRPDHLPITYEISHLRELLDLLC